MSVAPKVSRVFTPVVVIRTDAESLDRLLDRAEAEIERRRREQEKARHARTFSQNDAAPCTLLTPPAARKGGSP